MKSRRSLAIVAACAVAVTAVVALLARGGAGVFPNCLLYTSPSPRDS